MPARSPAATVSPPVNNAVGWSNSLGDTGPSISVMPDLDRMKIANGFSKRSDVCDLDFSPLLQEQPNTAPPSGLELLTGVSEWYRLRCQNGSNTAVRPTVREGRVETETHLPELELFRRPWLSTKHAHQTVLLTENSHSSASQKLPTNGVASPTVHDRNETHTPLDPNVHSPPTSPTEQHHMVGKDELKEGALCPLRHLSRSRSVSGSDEDSSSDSVEVGNKRKHACTEEIIPNVRPDCWQVSKLHISDPCSLVVRIKKNNLRISNHHLHKTSGGPRGGSDQINAEHTEINPHERDYKFEGTTESERNNLDQTDAENNHLEGKTIFCASKLSEINPDSSPFTANATSEHRCMSAEQSIRLKETTGVRCSVTNHSTSSNLANMPTAHLPLRKRHKRSAVSLNLIADETSTVRVHIVTSVPLVHPKTPPCDKLSVESKYENSCSPKDEHQELESDNMVQTLSTSNTECAPNHEKSPGCGATIDERSTVTASESPISGSSSDLSGETSELSPFTATPSSGSLRTTPDPTCSLADQSLLSPHTQHAELEVDRHSAAPILPNDTRQQNASSLSHRLPESSQVGHQQMTRSLFNIQSLLPQTSTQMHPQATGPYQQMPVRFPPFPHQRFPCDPRLPIVPPQLTPASGPLLHQPPHCFHDASYRGGPTHQLHASAEGLYPSLPYHLQESREVDRFPSPLTRPQYPFLPYIPPSSMPPPPHPLQVKDMRFHHPTPVPTPYVHSRSPPNSHPSPFPRTQCMPLLDNSTTAQRSAPAEINTTQNPQSSATSPPTIQPSTTHAPTSSATRSQSNGHYAPLKRAPGRSRHSNHLSSGVTVGDGSFLCEVCNKVFPLQRLLNRHMKCHSALKRYNCAFCSKGFNDTFDLKRHVRTHTGVRPYKCERCNKAFTQRCSLESHLSKVHRLLHDYQYKQRRSKVFVCEECGRTTENAEDHYEHIRDVHPNSVELLKFQEKIQFQKLLRRDGTVSPSFSESGSDPMSGPSSPVRVTSSVPASSRPGDEGKRDCGDGVDTSITLL
ncbi:uncharacterized protein LOC117301845 [Asterias rubens]|uniref:uncharacterized protein LOC117301845 n=1 Tax=Asterias rubens TaxID=7604 RepID=UPI0014556E21|nr:uncharacterized protein LOC117301845 [Asterias rubens]